MLPNTVNPSCSRGLGTPIACFNCLLNKPISLSYAVFENGSDFLSAPWESREGFGGKP